MTRTVHRTTPDGAGRPAVGHRARRACAAGAALGALALAAAGCGSDHDASTAKAGTGAAQTAQQRQQALHDQVIAALSHPSTERYGGRPTYLPKATIPAHRVVTARPGHAVLAIEGDTVAVALPGARARTTVVGPDVPDKDQGTFQNTARVSFDVTFAAVHGAVPLARSMFLITDELGATHRPRISLRGGGRPPAFAPRGRPITITLHTTLPIGNGRVKYLPAGRHAVASWDFDSETD